MVNQDKTVPYFNLYASDFLAYKTKLSEKEMVEVLEAICDICLFGHSGFKSDNKFQMLFFEKLENDLLRNSKKYIACVENGKKGGRPKKSNKKINEKINLDKTEKKPMGFENKNQDVTKHEPSENQYNTIQYNTIEYNKIKENNDINKNDIKRIDTYSDPIADKCFNMYSEICKNLLPLRFEKRSRDIRDLLSNYLYETNNDLEYFKEVCTKANEQKQICDVRLDFKGVLKNHISIYNEKFKKAEKGKVVSKLKFK